MSHRGAPDHIDVTSSWLGAGAPGRREAAGANVTRRRRGRRTAACAAGSGSVTPGPLRRLSPPATRPGAPAGAASLTANPLNTLAFSWVCHTPVLDILRRLESADFSRDLRSRCWFAVHWPGNPEASPRSHGMPCRSSIRDDAGARLTLTDSLKISCRTDIRGEARRRFLPGVRAGLHAAILMAFIGPVPGIDVLRMANPSMKAGCR